MTIIKRLNPKVNTQKRNTDQLLLLCLLRPRETCEPGHARKAVGKTLPRTSTASCTAHHTLEAANTTRVVSFILSILLLVVLVVLLTFVILTAPCLRSIHGAHGAWPGRHIHHHLARFLAGAASRACERLGTVTTGERSGQARDREATLAA
jgi:hypothetical protein